MKKLVVFLCAVILVFAGFLTPCHAMPVTEFYQSGTGSYGSIELPGFGTTGPITSTIDFTYPADQKYTFDFDNVGINGSFVAQNDDLFHFQLLDVLSLPPISLRVNETGMITGGDPTHFTAAVSAIEIVDPSSYPFGGLGLSYSALYEVTRNETTGIGTLNASLNGFLFNTGSDPIDIKGTGFYTSGQSPVPEPTTMLLFGAGLVGLAGFGRKRFKK
jgi:hypothetical protein